MKKNKEFEKYIQSVINKYIPILMLEKYTFDIFHKTEYKDSLFECKVVYPYLNAEIRYSQSAIKKYLKDKNLEPYIVHELCHLITDPFYSKAVSRYVTENEIEDERENLTDYICNIVMKKI